MELRVHRLRFGGFMPAAVKAVATDPFSGKLAVGREDGEIEIYEPKENFAIQARFPGVKDLKLQALTWSHDAAYAGRLFGVSQRGFIFEVCLVTGSVKNLRDTYGGAAWCITASPRENILAVGGDDGLVRLFNYGENGSLEYVKSLNTSGARLLCAAYHPTEPQLIVGGSDGTLRVLEETSGRTVSRMTADVNFGVFTPSLWACTVLPDSTIITGDSRGQVQIWDGALGVMTETFTQHTADILTVVATPDGSTVFASGVDGKIISLQRSLGPDGNPSGAWTYSHSHRTHTHDVFSMAICATPKQKVYPGKKWTLVSGGLDGKLCFYAADEFDRQRPMWMPVVPSNTLVSHAADYSVMSLRHQRHVDLWSTSLDTSDASAVAASETATPKLFLRMTSSGEGHFEVAELSPSGDILLTSTLEGTKLWGVVFDSEAEAVRLTKLEIPPALDGARGRVMAARFNKSGDRVAVYSPARSAILVFAVTAATEEEEASFELLQTLDWEPASVDNSDLSMADRSLAMLVRRIAFSDDSRFLAVSNATSEVCIYDLSAANGSGAKHWSITRLRSLVESVTFLSGDSTAGAPKKKKTAVSVGNAHQLLLTFANNTILAYDVASLTAVSWANGSTDPLAVPHSLKFPLAGASVDPTGRRQAMLYGQLHTVFLDLDAKVPTTPKVVAPFHLQKKATEPVTKKSGKRKAEEEPAAEAEALVDGPNMALIETYRNILHLGYLPAGQGLVVLENPWSLIAEQMPAAIARKRYGT